MREPDNTEFNKITKILFQFDSANAEIKSQLHRISSVSTEMIWDVL